MVKMKTYLGDLEIDHLYKDSSGGYWAKVVMERSERSFALTAQEYRLYKSKIEKEE